jgi:hypothetical protein
MHLPGGRDQPAVTALRLSSAALAHCRLVCRAFDHRTYA